MSGATARFAIVRAGEGSEGPATDLADGLRVTVLVGAEQGAIHLETATAELAPGGTIGGHTHPFEESFFVLSGSGHVAIGDETYRVSPGDFGFAPTACPHAWSNPFDEPLIWLRVRAPQPRPIGEHLGTYPASHLAVPKSGRPISAEGPRQRFVGHFAESQLPPPGPLAMPGYHGYGIKDVSVRMMVDELLGARQHTLFVVEFRPSTVSAGMSAKEHFHPFEEIYYFTHGRANGIVGGEPCTVSAGDIVFAGVNTSHGFTNDGDVPMRWIEAQAPMPPTMHGTIFEADWLD